MSYRPLFGKTAFSLEEHLDTIPISICSSSKQNLEYDLLVAGNVFSDLLQQYLQSNPSEQPGKVIVDVYEPITIDESSCDFSSIKQAASRSQNLAQKILESQKARNSTLGQEKEKTEAATEASIKTVDETLMLAIEEAKDTEEGPGECLIGQDRA